MTGTGTTRTSEQSGVIAVLALIAGFALVLILEAYIYHDQVARLGVDPGPPSPQAPGGTAAGFPTP